MSSDIENWPPPTDPSAFESLCLELFKEIWSDPTAQKNGRSGQEQAGVDIFSQRPGLHAGVQCKQKSGLLRSRLTEQELKDEAKAAEDFQPQLKSFVLATTAPRDARVQECARLLSEENHRKGLFTVEVWSWQDIWPEIYKREELLRRVGPDYWPRLAGGAPTRGRKWPTLVVGVTFLVLALLAAGFILTRHSTSHRRFQLGLITAESELLLTNDFLYRKPSTSDFETDGFLIVPVTSKNESVELTFSVLNTNSSLTLKELSVAFVCPKRTNGFDVYFAEPGWHPEGPAPNDKKRGFAVELDISGLLPWQRVPLPKIGFRPTFKAGDWNTAPHHVLMQIRTKEEIDEIQFDVFFTVSRKVASPHVVRGRRLPDDVWEVMLPADRPSEPGPSGIMVKRIPE